jgi:hypothetical protein
MFEMKHGEAVRTSCCGIVCDLYGISCCSHSKRVEIGIDLVLVPEMPHYTTRFRVLVVSRYRCKLTITSFSYGLGPGVNLAAKGDGLVRWLTWTFS